MAKDDTPLILGELLLRRDAGGPLLARFQRNRWQISGGFKIGSKPLTDGPSMAAGSFHLPGQHLSTSMAWRSSKLAVTGIGIMTFERAYLTRNRRLNLA